MTTTTLSPSAPLSATATPLSPCGPVDPKITPAHLTRRVLIYVRQSSPTQVQRHPESARRQYALAERAQRLGWAAEQITIIDEDQGKSGAGSAAAHERDGFSRLVSAVGLGEVEALGDFLREQMEAIRAAARSASVAALVDGVGGLRRTAPERPLPGPTPPGLANTFAPAAFVVHADTLFAPRCESAASSESHTCIRSSKCVSSKMRRICVHLFARPRATKRSHVPSTLRFYESPRDTTS